MFVLKKRESYAWPVQFRIAVDGRYEDHEFTAEFKRLPQQRLDEIFGMRASGTPKISDDEFVREILIGWKNITKEDGSDMLFNEDALTTLLNVPGVRTAVIKAYFESVSGITEKN